MVGYVICQRHFTGHEQGMAAAQCYDSLTPAKKNGCLGALVVTDRCCVAVLKLR